LIELLPSVTYVMEPEAAGGALVYVSPQAEELFGYPVELWTSDPDFWHSVVHPDDTERVDAAWAAAGMEDSFTLRYRYVTADDRIVWVQDSGTMVRDPAGTPLHWLGVVVDITERVEVEDELRRREAILHAVAFAAERFLVAPRWDEAADEILARLGAAAQVSRVYVFENRHLDDGTLVADQRAEWVADGISRELDNPSLQGFDFHAVGYGQWADRMRVGEAVQGHVDEVGELQRRLFAEQDILSLVLVPVFTDGGWWGFMGFDDCVEGRLFPPIEIEALRAAAGTLGAALRRERAQQALAEAEDRFRTLVEQVPATTHISRLDRTASTIYISPQVEALLGYTPAEWLADADLWVKVLHPDDRAAAIAGSDRFLATGEPFSMEYRMRHKDGHVVWVREEATMLRDGEGTPVSAQGIMVDVSDRRRTAEELQRSLELFERSDAERRELVAHLVRAQEQERVRIAGDIHDDPLQKLTAVGMRLSGVRRELGDGAPESLVHLERTVSGAIASLRNLLFEVRPPALDREGLAVALQQYLRETASETDLEWEVHDRLWLEPPPEVRVICYRIAQEALTNVRKHANAFRVDVELATDEDGVRVRVIDDGTGMRIDDPGTGVGHLGIPSMRERAALSGGGLQLRDAPGGGTVVEFWIPTALPSP